jgi:hypothetical protein
VSAPELIAAVVFALLGLRSLVYWLRRPVASAARRDHLLYALFVVSRAGLWFALAGLFLLYAGVRTQGRAFLEDAGDYRWYFAIVLVLAGVQFAAGFLLGGGRNATRDPGRNSDSERGLRP